MKQSPAAIRPSVSLTFASMAATAATFSVALLMQTQAFAQSPSAPEPAPASQAAVMQMVSARVAVLSDLDSAKVKDGDSISTRLAQAVTLRDGKVLPAGTKIIGIVVADDSQASGASKLALNFSKAQLKDGSTVPLKATMVGIYAAQSQDINGRPIAPGDQRLDTWQGHPDSVDEIGAIPGVDLHSRVTGQNSGVLVSTSRHDVKIKYGMEIALAVAPAKTTAQGE